MKTKKLFGGKWLRVVDDLVDSSAAHMIPECYRVAGLRIKGHVAPFGGSWIQKKNEIVLLEAPTRK